MKDTAANGSKKKRILKNALKLILCFHLGTQANYCYTGSRQTEQRLEFEERFGLEIQGFRDDVEGEEGNLSRLTQAVYKEKLEKDFDLKAIRISSENYLKRSILGQLEFIVIRGEAYDGINYPFDNLFLKRIYLSHDFASSTAHHEIKHAKTDHVLKQHQEFKEKWINLAKDENGNSLYSGYGSWLFSKVRIVGSFVDSPSYDYEENERLGFLNSYSRLWFYEDIAEIGEAAEEKFLVGRMIRLLYEDKNEIITAKVNLAQEYGLIPAEYSKYIKVQKDFKDHEMMGDSSDALLEASDEFLSRHLGSVYEINLRNMRGNLLERKGDLTAALWEYRKGLDAGYKDHYYYLEILSSIMGCYTYLGESEKAALYEKAKEKYQRAWDDNDVKTVIFGVNDFLKDNGEL